jgi:hypothetical protein
MGDIWNGRRHGRGVYFFENGTYEGEWENDVIEGKGKGGV